MLFKDRLRELREAAGLTQTQLAEISGLPLGSIRNYEQGQREPFWTVVFRLAAAMKVPVDAFSVCIDLQTPIPEPTPPKTRGRPKKQMPDESKKK